MRAVKNGKRTRDLTQGNIAVQIILFAIPILLSQTFQNLYNSVDSIVVGNFVGVAALASVTSSSDICHAIVGFFTGLSTGSGVLFSRYFGAKDFEKLHRSIHTSILFSVILGVGMSVLGIVVTPWLLHIVNCPEDVYAQSMVYLRIYLVGVFLTSIYNVASGVLRAVGDSRSPFYYLTAASITNIILDFVFVVLFHMGVAGVAFATIFSQLLSCTLVIRRMLKTDECYKLVIRDLKIDNGMLKEIFSLGMPAAFQTCITSLANLVTQSYLNSFGSAAMAGAGAAKKIDKYLGLVGNSLGLSATTYVSQNVGADRYDRAFKGIWDVCVMSFVFLIFIGIPVYFNAETCLKLFTRDPEALMYGAMMMHIMIPFYYAQSLHHIFGNVVRGFGRSFVTMLTTLLGMVGCRQLFLNVSMHIHYDIRIVFFTYPVGWICSALFAMIYFAVRIMIPYYRQKNNNDK